MRWFSHRRRTGGRYNCITYLLTDVVAWPTATIAMPTSICWFFLRSDAANRHILRRGDPGVGLSSQIRTRARFLYSAPNRQVSLSFTFNRSEVILLTNKQTQLKTSTSLRYATPVGKKYNLTNVSVPTNIPL